MAIITPIKDYVNLKFKDDVSIQCDICKQIFTRSKRRFYYSHREKIRKKQYDYIINFCSKKCEANYKTRKQLIICQICNKEFYRSPSTVKMYKSNSCSYRCSRILRNSFERYGNQRSKLELYIESKLKEKYSNIEIIYNDKKTIGYELDIYIPSLKLAFELNGIFHYEPIFGEKTLNRMQFNDKQKFGLCQQNMISLCIIDTSSQRYFKEKTSQKYLDIIFKIIEEKNKVHTFTEP
ncbi:MAG: hypothetical protein AABY22_27035 [Nanoarchaeota archaeon]